MVLFCQSYTIIKFRPCKTKGHPSVDLPNISACIENGMFYCVTVYWRSKYIHLDTVTMHMYSPNAYVCMFIYCMCVYVCENKEMSRHTHTYRCIQYMLYIQLQTIHIHTKHTKHTIHTIHTDAYRCIQMHTDTYHTHILALLINSTEAGNLLRGNDALHAMLGARTRARMQLVVVIMMFICLIARLLV